MKQLVDIHQHILFGLDDGAANIEMAQQMLEEAARQQIGHIVCTSHCQPEYDRFDTEKYLRHFAMLQDFIAERKLPIQLYKGNEILWTSETPEALRRKKVFPLADTRNVLVEFMPEIPFEDMQRAVKDLMSVGYVVVIAHVERYKCLETHDRLARLREEYGIVAQMNALTAIESGKILQGSYVRGLLKRDLIDIVASDVHNVGNRRCIFQEAYEFLTKKYGVDTADRLCVVNPGKMIGLN